MVKYTSASGRHSKNSNEFGVASNEVKVKYPPPLTVCFLLVACYLLFVATSGYAGLIDRVVAFVDDRAITLSEFTDTYEKTKKVKPDISKEEVLNTLINRVILLREAKKLKIEAKTDDELLNGYIELKVKAFVRLREDDLKEFYNNHLSEFKDAGYDAVRDKIEEYLTEKEINNLLKRHIVELKSKAYVKIVMKEL